MSPNETISAPGYVMSDGPDPACIVQICGGRLGSRYGLTDGDITIGREPNNTVVLDLPSVSRHHARLFQNEGAYWVADCGSTNGTYVRDQRIDGTSRLSSGDLVGLGGAVFKFLAGGNIEAEYFETIHYLTVTDGLTRIANRRYFKEFLDREWMRCSRHTRPLTLARLDIDHFKELNSSYGHLAGDQVLEQMAQVISREIRGEELLARYGGDEFAFVLAETDGAGAMVFAERIRGLVESSVFKFEEKRIRASVSIGVAVFDPASHKSTDELIKAAGQNLYRAKCAGRGRVAGPGPGLAGGE